MRNLNEIIDWIEKISIATSRQMMLLENQGIHHVICIAFLRKGQE